MIPTPVPAFCDPTPTSPTRQTHRTPEPFLAGRGRTLVDARREDLEAFLGELLLRRAAETVATRYRRR
jgi:hypothetical protein